MPRWCSDYVAAKTSIPWLEIIFYVAMIGSIGMLFMSMYRGGAGGGIMNVGRAKVRISRKTSAKATFADVAGADEEKAELQEVVEFLKAPGKFNSLGARIPHGVLLVGPRYRQDPAGARLRRRGRCAVLRDLRLRLRGNVCRCRCLPCA